MLLDSWHNVFSAAAAAPATARSPSRPAPAAVGGGGLPRDHPPVPFSSLEPPPGCPMHKGDGGSAGASSSVRSQGRGMSGGSSEQSLARAAAAFSSSESSASGSTSRSWSETLNPLNMMPFLSNARASEKQSVVLPTERTVSTIPRSGSSPPPGASPYDGPAPVAARADSGAAKCPVSHGNGSAGGAQGSSDTNTSKTYWEYPSPQQFYNALVRKGWETPEEHVETMVLIHNWLNEAAWKEVLEWERLAGVDPDKVELARFQGKPGTLSPKARVFSWLGTIMPSRFQSEPPFDRHDWVVRRPEGQEVRYIIDYYTVPESQQANAADEPEFVLDIRPALDSVGSAWVRVHKTWEEYMRREGAEAGAAAQAAAGDSRR